jgi:DNA-binding NarL/FixJ family response regulator
MKILVVDDEQLDLFITKKLLSLEFEVEGFTTLEATVDWAKNNSFDIVLIDYYLAPGLYAHDALKELLLIKGNTFKAFVLSNYVDGKQAQELKDVGFSDIIYKPLTIEKFKDYLSVKI